MVRKIAKYASSFLGFAAIILVVVNKFPLGDKEVPEVLRKK